MLGIQIAGQIIAFCSYTLVSNTWRLHCLPRCYMEPQSLIESERYSKHCSSTVATPSEFLVCDSTVTLCPTASAIWYCRAPALFAALLRRAGVAPALLPLLAEPAQAAVQSLGILARRRHPGHTAAFLASLKEICAGTSHDAQLVRIL